MKENKHYQDFFLSYTETQKKWKFLYLVEVSVSRTPPHLEPIVRYLRNGLETKLLHDHSSEQRMIYFDHR